MSLIEGIEPAAIGTAKMIKFLGQCDGRKVCKYGFTDTRVR